MQAVVDFPKIPTARAYSQLQLEFHREIQTLFSWMDPSPRPCFNSDLLDEIRRSEQLLEVNEGYINDKGSEEQVTYVVFASRTPGVFNLGGDLNMFIPAIMRKDSATLGKYAHLCIDNIYRRADGFGANITTIALIQGKALGGGFEAALAADIIIAERSSTMSFPEVLFNMFPGMGALSFLSRRVGSRRAEEIISSGQVYSCKDMHELGIVDEIVDDGLGYEATMRFILTRKKRANSHRALQLAKRHLNPVSLVELRSIVDVWVDAAMRLDTRDLRMMARLVRAQDKLAVATAEDHLVEMLYSPNPLTAANGI